MNIEDKELNEEVQVFKSMTTEEVREEQLKGLHKQIEEENEEKEATE